MRTARVPLAVLTSVIAVLFLACSSGGSSDSADDDDNEEASATSTRPANTRPAATATPTAKGGAPKFTPGDWTAGEAETRVTGGATLTVKGTLNNQAASDKDTTRLIFVDGTDTIFISISTVYQPFAIGVYKEPTDVRPDSASPCDVNYTDTSDKKVVGSFRCAHVTVSSRGSVASDSTLEGTFSASR